jgi:hypothetical protein
VKNREKREKNRDFGYAKLIKSSLLYQVHSKHGRAYENVKNSSWQLL